ncbi:MAG: YabP/YqfC family sporulation protein [Firmicutes bacterium]|nr:YabP/YqfC family sporulation protein [Bacillota bacterium]
MSFFSEIAKRAGLSELSLSGGYNVVNYNGEAIYVEGVRRLLRVEEEEIAIELRGAVVTLRGAGLNIFELSDGVIINGRVEVMGFVKNENKGKVNKDEKRKKKK